VCSLSSPLSSESSLVILGDSILYLSLTSSSVSTSISDQVLSKGHPLVHTLLAPVPISARRTIKVLDLNTGGSVGIAVCGDADSAGIADLACVAVAVAVKGVSVEDAVAVKSVRVLADAATLGDIVEGTCDVDDASGVVRVAFALPAGDRVGVVIAEMWGDVGSEVGTAGGGSADAGGVVVAAVDTEGVGCVSVAVSVVGVALAVAVGGCIGIEGAGIDDGVASIVVAAGVAVGGVGVINVGVAAGCIGAVVAEMWVLRGAGDVRGIGLSVARVKGVR